MFMLSNLTSRYHKKSHRSKKRSIFSICSNTNHRQDIISQDVETISTNVEQSPVTQDQLAETLFTDVEQSPVTQHQLAEPHGHEHHAVAEWLAYIAHKGLPAIRGIITIADLTAYILKAGVEKFLPGRSGMQIASAIEDATAVATTALHGFALKSERELFYESRSTQNEKHPTIEAWAKWTNNKAAGTLEMLNILTQLVATDRISLAQVLFTIQAITTLASCVIYIPSNVVIGVHCMSVSNALHMNAPIFAAATISNYTFDRLATEIVRPMIYYVSDRLEGMLDRVGWVNKIKAGVAPSGMAMAH
jgi:hypothetical protein